MIFISLALSSEGLFSSVKIAHACSEAQTIQTIQAADSHCMNDQIDSHQPAAGCASDGHPCHIGHCPALLTFHSVETKHLPVFETEYFIPKELYLSPTPTGLLRPPAKLSA